jgi:hypothetical protein
MALQQQQISYLEEKATRNEQELNQANAKLDQAHAKLEMLKTLPAALSPQTRSCDEEKCGESDSSNKSPQLESPTHGNESTHVAASEVVAEALTESSWQEKATVPPARQPVEQRLVFGAIARENAESGSNKGVFVAMVLEDLYRQGCLKQSAWKSISPPSKYKEKQLLKNTLELCEAVMNEDKSCALRSSGLSSSNLKKHATNIERKCKRQMWEYEGCDPDLKEQIKKHKNKSQQKQATYLAIGRRA